jgi:hypothetical protein
VPWHEFSLWHPAPASSSEGVVCVPRLVGPTACPLFVPVKEASMNASFRGWSHPPSNLAVPLFQTNRTDDFELRAVSRLARFSRQRK